jgi:hypothetical protein
MQLLLMSEQQVSPRKAPGALCALKRLFLCVRAFVSLQMLQSREAPVAGSAYVRPRLVRLGGRKRRGDGGRGRRRLRGLDRRCNQSVTTPLSNISRSNLLLLLLALAESSLMVKVGCRDSAALPKFTAMSLMRCDVRRFRTVYSWKDRLARFSPDSGDGWY